MTLRKTPAIRTEGLVGRERLREALAHLREALPNGLTREQLAARLGGVSLRSVDRAIKLLEAQGAHLERQRVGHPAVIRFKIERGPTWDEHVSAEARLALHLAGLMLGQAAASSLEDQVSTIEEMVSRHMSSKDRRLFESLKSAIQVGGGIDDFVPEGDVLEPVLRALELGRELEMTYRVAGKKEGEARTVVPHAITLDIFSGGSFLAAWDLGDRRPKHFRLSRIEKAKVGSRPGAISNSKAMHNAATYQIGGWTCGDDPFTVVARIHGAHWIESFNAAQPALPGFEAHPDDGVVEVRFKANHLNGAARWILQFGAMAEVLEPADLREHVRLQLETAAVKYR